MESALWFLWAWLTGASLAIVSWGLRGDAARGRRRCPRCWYDLGGSPTPRCPECGYRETRELNLHRVRRRWRPALVGTCLLIVLTAASVASSARGGWRCPTVPLRTSGRQH